MKEVNEVKKVNEGKKVNEVKKVKEGKEVRKVKKVKEAKRKVKPYTFFLSNPFPHHLNLPHKSTNHPSSGANPDPCS